MCMLVIFVVVCVHDCCCVFFVLCLSHVVCLFARYLFCVCMYVVVVVLCVVCVVCSAFVNYLFVCLFVVFL